MYYNGNSVAVPAPAGSPAISVYNNISFDCKNVDLYYGSFQALKGINLRIEKNQITALIGPSGCGKSTFLRSLNRMNDLIDGVQINGKIRERISIRAGVSKEELEKMVLGMDSVRKRLEGNTIVRIVVVPDRLVNIVVKETCRA